MKYTLIIIFYAFGLIHIEAQDLSEIRKYNVFFILFEQDDLSEKKILNHPDRPIIYKFYKNKKEIYPFKFYYTEYFDSDDQANEINQTMVYSIHKKFLRKNKDIIITKEFIDKIGESKLINLLYGANKHVFLIDKSEIKDNKIVIREVLFSPQLYE